MHLYLTLISLLDLQNLTPEELQKGMQAVNSQYLVFLFHWTFDVYQKNKLKEK